MMKIKIYILVVTICCLCMSCKKFVEVDYPIDRYTAGQVYSNPISAISVITSAYGNLASNYMGLAGQGDAIPLRTGIMGDELVPAYDVRLPEWQNEVLPIQGHDYWSQAYTKLIYTANSVIEGVESSVQIKNEMKDRLIGEAKFIRAFTYFYLVNLYGDVPLVISTDFKTNSEMPRTKADLVYDLIIKDLKDAQNMLTGHYLGSDLSSNSQERIRPNKFAATALLSRVYLYQKEWGKAEVEASKIIGEQSTYQLVNLDQVFKKDSKEAIWQLQPNPIKEGGSTNVGFAQNFIPNWIGASPDFVVAPSLFKIFQTSDARRNKWFDYSGIDGQGNDHLIPGKYKIGNSKDGSIQEQIEYIMIFRLAEQYFIRSECRANLGDFNGALSDLNKIRVRSNLDELTTTVKNEILDSVSIERQRELFVEFGDRWLDLKRTGKIDEVMRKVSPTKLSPFSGVTPTWNSYMALLPIPPDEFRNNSALRGHQNPGYTEQ